MSKTREELVNEVAEELKILGAGQTLSNEDQDKINKTIGPALAELEARGIVGGIELSDIPDAFFQALAQVVARAAATAFGLTGQELVDAITNAADAERRLLNMTLARATGQKSQPEYM